MADRDPEQDILFKEVDEELRQEQFSKLWKQYGKYAIGAAVSLVAAVGGYQAWQAWDLNRRTADSLQFAGALQAIQSEDAARAQEILGRLATKGTAGYAVLARLNQASLIAQRGDKATAAAAYFAIADDTGVDEIFRDMAVILGTIQDLDRGNSRQLTSRLQPLLAGGSPWRHSAKELTAWLLERQGGSAEARQLFQELADDVTAPPGIRGRAAEKLAMLGTAGS